MSKHDKIAKLKEYIKNIVIKELEKDEELDEVSTTATAGIDGTGTGHYDTPHAFSSGSAVGHKSPEVGGYKKVNESFVSSGKVSDVFLKLKSKGFGNKKFGDISKELSKYYKTPGLADVMASMFKEIWMKGNKKEAEKEVLDWLKTVAKKSKLESVNEGYGEMMDELEKIYRPSGAPPIAKEALKDLADEYDIGRVLYAARTNRKSFMEVMDMKIDQLQSQYVNKKHINTIKRGKKLREGRYHDWRNDESMTPKQKIGISVREVRDALNELDKRIKMNLRLKTELSVDSRSYWKNTHKALNKISERLVKLATKVGSMK